MKRTFLSFLLTAACSFLAFTSEIYTKGSFTYTISDSGEATICSYIGSDSIVVVPSEIDGYPVTSISGLFGSTTAEQNKNITEIHIPQTVTKLKGNLTYNLQKLQIVVIENGDLTVDNLGCFKMTNSIGTINLREIIVLSPCSLTSTQMIGSAKISQLIKVNEFTVTFEDGQTKSIQIYVIKEKIHPTIKQQHFEDLMSAFSRHGIDINSLAEINLSQMVTGTDTRFSFGDFDPSSLLPVGARVVTSDTTYTSVGYTIEDGTDFNPPAIDLDSRINYSRTDTKAWNSVCLPFSIQESDFPEGTKIYTFQAVDQEGDAATIHLSRLSNDEILPAGTPCYIYSNAEEWNLMVDSTPLSKTAIPLKTEVGNWRIVGSFTAQTIGAGKYKMNADGSSFGITTEDAGNSPMIYPYRCYIEPINASANAPSRLHFTVDGSNGLEEVQTDSRQETRLSRMFDLFGRPRKAGTSGLFIKAK